MKRRAFLTATATAAFMPSLLRAQTLTPPPIEAYARDPEIGQAAISPDGTKLAFIASDGDRKYILVNDLKTNKQQATPVDSFEVEKLMFVSNSHLIFSTFYFRDHLRYPYRNLHIMDVVTSKFTTVRGRLFTETNYSESQIFRFNKDGKDYVAVEFGGEEDSVGNIKSSFAFQLLKFDLTSKALKSLPFDHGSNSTQTRVVDRDGNLIAREEFKASDKRWWIEMNIGNRFTEVFGLDQAIDLPSLLGMGRDGKTVILHFQVGEHAGHLMELRNDGSLKRIFDQPAYTYWPLFHPTTERLCGYYTYEHWCEYHFDDPEMLKIDTAVKEFTDGYRYLYASFADDPRKTIIYYEGDDEPGKYVLLDLTTGKDYELGGTYTEIQAPFISEKKSITYKARDGMDIQAYLSLPAHKTTGPYALVVLPHRGPTARDYLGFDDMVQFLTARGYAVLQPNYRGSSGFTQDFEAAGYGQWGRKMQTDLSDGVKHLIDQGITTTSRVSIMGEKYGGYAAMAGLCFEPEVYNSAITLNGYYDLKYHFYDEQFSVVGKLYYDRNWKDVDPETVSPNKLAAQIKAPALLIHGKKSKYYEEQGHRMHDSMKKAGKDVTLIYMETEGDSFIYASSRQKMYLAIENFLAKHNPA